MILCGDICLFLLWNCFFLPNHATCMDFDYEETNFDKPSLPRGHLKPLGSHKEANFIDELYDTPSASDFWNDYVKVSKPVVLRGAVKDSNAFKLWTSKYLHDTYGNLEVRLESKVEASGRVPIGAKGLGRDTIGNFVSKYQDNDAYIISELPTPMWTDILVPSCLTCGSFLHKFVEVDLWMSSKGSHSLLHKDAFNTINCLYNGTKEWKLIDYKYEAMIYKAEESEYEIGGFSLIDVHSVDLVKYPLLKDVPWSHVIIHPGDCLFLPKSYYHQVNSFGNTNVAVAILFSRLDDLKEFNNTGCGNQTSSPLSDMDVDWKYPGYGKLSMGNPSLETMRKNLKITLNKEKYPESQSSLTMLEELLLLKGDGKALFKEVNAKLNRPEDNHITEEDLDSLSKNDLRDIFVAFEPYEPSNHYTYEYSYIKEKDIRSLLNNLIRLDGGVYREKWEKLYQEDLGGTRAFASQLFEGFQSSNKSMASTEEVMTNINTVLEPYIYYRNKTAFDLRSHYDSVDDDYDYDDSEDNDDRKHSTDNEWISIDHHKYPVIKGVGGVHNSQQGQDDKRRKFNQLSGHQESDDVNLGYKDNKKQNDGRNVEYHSFQKLEHHNYHTHNDNEEENSQKNEL